MEKAGAGTQKGMGQMLWGGQGRGEAMGAWGGNGEKMFGCRVGMGTNSCPHVTLYQRPLTVLNLADLMQTGISLISCR